MPTHDERDRVELCTIGEVTEEQHLQQKRNEAFDAAGYCYNPFCWGCSHGMPCQRNRFKPGGTD